MHQTDDRKKGNLIFKWLIEDVPDMLVSLVVESAGRVSIDQFPEILGLSGRTYGLACQLH